MVGTREAHWATAVSQGEFWWPYKYEGRRTLTRMQCYPRTLPSGKPLPGVAPGLAALELCSKMRMFPA